MLIGKHKMAPKLSPKKSVEGGIGGIAGAALIAVLYALAINHWGNAGVSVASFAIIGAAGGAISQIGDLAASAIKRNHDIKDYGKLIPGHGGILDRFDSIIFTAPINFLSFRASLRKKENRCHLQRCEDFLYRCGSDMYTLKKYHIPP